MVNLRGLYEQLTRQAELLSEGNECREFFVPGESAEDAKTSPICVFPLLEKHRVPAEFLCKATFCL